MKHVCVYDIHGNCYFYYLYILLDLIDSIINTKSTFGIIILYLYTYTLTLYTKHLGNEFVSKIFGLIIKKLTNKCVIYVYGKLKKYYQNIF